MTPRRWIVLASIPIAVAVLVHRFGQIVYLTRTDRVLDPIRMASRSFDLWNPYWDMGAIQFQTVGYWLPFDMVFSLGKVLGVAPWLTERLFIASLILLALWGFVRLADGLTIGRPLFRLLGGLFYALSPVMLSRVGFQTVFAMGVALLPWTLIPLVRGSESGSPRRAAARSAVAVAIMGGANASVVLAVLPVPLLYLLTRRRGARRARLLAWWVVMVPMATMWWLVGLYFFSRYGPDVLAYTEQVDDTVSTTSIFEVLRGTADWVSRLVPGIPAGFYLVTRHVAILATATVAALGLAGLSRRRLPEQTFLVLCLLAGVVAVGGGFGGLFGNLFAGEYRWLLEGPLRAFRNVYKFQALITLPLSLGATSALSALCERRPVVRRPRTEVVVASAAFVLLAVAALPLWNNQLTRGPGFDAVPSAWADANRQLAAETTGRVLVVPGLSEADFDWGYAAQLPLEWGSDLAWATRSQAPLSGVESLQFLDAVELAIERGGDPGLVDHLRRGGFSRVVVPSDQLSDRYGAPSVETVNSALLASGLEPSAGFGRLGYGFGEIHQIEVYTVPDAARVVMYPASSATWLSGDIESIMNVPTTLFGDRPYLVVHDPGPVPDTVDPEQWLITDGRQAYEQNFGFSRNNRSYVHGRGDLPSGIDAQDATVLSLSGVESLTASSVGPGVFARNAPAFQPSNVVDGDVSTVWQPARFEFAGTDVWGASDPWIDIRFDAPRHVDSIGIDLMIGELGIATPIEVTTTTDAGAVVSTLEPSEDRQPLDLDPGTTSHVRVSIALDSYRAFGDVIGIRELSIGGLEVDRRLAVPSQLTQAFVEPAADDPAWIFTRGRSAVAPLVSLIDEDQIARSFTVPKAGDFAVLPTASARRSPALVDFLGVTPLLTVTAESTLGNNPAASPRNLIDGDSTTKWRSSRTTRWSRPRTVVSFEWDTERTLSEFHLDLGDDVAVPINAVVRAGGEIRVGNVAADGSVVFPAVTGMAMTVTFGYEQQFDGEGTPWIGFDGIDIPALADLYPGPIDPLAPAPVSCDDGLSVEVGGDAIGFSAQTTVGSLIDADRIELTACGDGIVALDAGSVLLDASSGASLLTIDQIVIGNRPTLSVADEAGRAIDVDTWKPTRRQVDIAAGSDGLLVVNEIFNDGWTASLDGQALEPIRIDGWRQGFVVPAGPAGTVSLTFGPDRAFKLGTLLGLLTLFAVVVLAVVPDRRRAALEATGEGRVSPVLLIVIAVVGALASVGVAALLLPVLWWVRRVMPSVLPWIAFGSLVSAALVHVIATRVLDLSVTAWGISSSPVSLLASVSLLAVIVVLLPTTRSRAA